MVFSGSIVTAQLPLLNWAKQMEVNPGPGGAVGLGSRGNSVAVDIWGNVYSTGDFKGTVDFDPGAGIYNLTSVDSVNDYDIFISKLDSSGNFIWAKCMGGSSDDYSYSIAVDLVGNVYTTGKFGGGVLSDFNPGPGVYNLYGFGGDDIFISKLDSAGNFVWAKQFGNIGEDSGISLAVDSQSNVYTVGSFGGTVDFDPGAGVYNLNCSIKDLFVLKLDSSGNFGWSIMISKGIFTNVGCSIDLDALGNVYIMGLFGGTSDFDPGVGIYNLTSSTNGSIFILKLSTAGNFIWAKKMEGGFASLGISIKIDPLNNIYTCGNYQGIADFDPGPAVFNLIPTTVTAVNIFIAKLDSAGNFVWAKSIGGNMHENIFDFDVDNFSNVYATGDFQGTTDFDPNAGIFNLTSLGDFDIFISKLDSNGNFVWAKQLGGNWNGVGQSIDVNFPDNIYTTGFFNGSTDFDPNIGVFNLTSMTSIGNTFIHRLGQCFSTTTSVSVNACNTYSLNGLTYTASGIYTQSLSNIYSCDSVIILNLTIDQITYSSANEIACDNYTIGGQTFASSGSYLLTFTSIGGCDSIVTLNLVVKTSSSNSIAVSSCSPYLLNGQSYTAAGIYTQILTNIEGCDSLLILNLTINSLDTSVMQSAFSLWSNAPAATYQWINCNNNLPISGATNQGYTIISGGSYAVIVTQFGCIDTSACYTINALGIVELTSPNLFRVFPNPTNRGMTIETPELLDASIKIMDLTGQLVLKQENLYGKSFTIDLHNLINGLYILEIESDRELHRVKIIKE